MQTEQRRRVNFVAAHPDPAPAPAPVAVVDAQPIQITDTSAAWGGVASPTRDSVSAVDRARAFQIRQIPIYIAGVGVALAGTLAYTLIALAAGIAAPWAADRLLVFLGLAVVALLVSHHRANVTDYEHTHAGTERLRIRTAADVRRAELDAELKLRLAALDAQIRLIESRNVQERPRRAIGVDHE